MSDLFGGLPLAKPTTLFERMAEAQRPAPPIAPPPPPPAPERVWPGKPVASFSCYCGALDEVLEPAPEWVTCWQKGCDSRMHRWTPRNPPPSRNARQLTDEERSRI